jgi:hypothetical protein
MQRLKGGWTTIAAMTALVCFILGVYFKPLSAGLSNHLATKRVKTIDRADKLDAYKMMDNYGTNPRVGPRQ